MYLKGGILKIKILGTRGKVKVSARGHSKHSGILLDEEILFDLGEKSFLKQKPKAILITHLHPDHAFFVKGGERLSTKISVYAPEKHLGCPGIKIISKILKIGSYQITPLPTIHSRKVKSQAYLVQKDDKKILYTGDLIWIEKKYHKYLQNLDLIITEASFIKKGGMVRRDKKTGEIFGHNGAPDLTHLFKRFTKHIVFIHFGSWFYKDIKAAKKELKQLGKENDIKVEVGYDGMKIKL